MSQQRDMNETPVSWHAGVCSFALINTYCVLLYNMKGRLAS